jgi:hypothetical protein
MDVPYFGCCRGQYSNRVDDIANMDPAGLMRCTPSLARARRQRPSAAPSSCRPGSIPGKARVVQCPEIVRAAYRLAGYDLHRVCYASKRIQSARTDKMPAWNNMAKATRTPLSDISEVLTFELTDWWQSPLMPRRQ